MISCFDPLVLALVQNYSYKGPGMLSCRPDQDLQASRTFAHRTLAHYWYLIRCLSSQ